MREPSGVFNLEPHLLTIFLNSIVIIEDEEDSKPDYQYKGNQAMLLS